MTVTTRTEARRPLTLRFLDDEVEADYRRKIVPRVRKQLRFSLLLVMPLWMLAAILYRLVTGSLETLVVAIPLLELFFLGLLIAERRAQTLTALYTIGVLSNAVAGLSLLYLNLATGLFPAIGMLATIGSASVAFTQLNLPWVLSNLASFPYVLGTIVILTVESVALRLR